MPTEAVSVRAGWRRRIMDVAAEAVIASPWLLFGWINYAIAGQAGS